MRNVSIVFAILSLFSTSVYSQISSVSPNQASEKSRVVATSHISYPVVKSSSTIPSSKAAQSNLNFVEGGITVFPNPTNKLVNIVIPTSDFDGESIIAIIDLQGRVVQYNWVETPILFPTSITMDIEQLSSGLYAIRVQQGDFAFNQKLMVR